MLRKKITIFLLTTMLASTVNTYVIPVKAATIAGIEATVGVGSLTSKNTTVPTSDRATPNEAQYKYHKDELAAFCHFGPNTFAGIEWGTEYGTKSPAEIFTLNKDFDAKTLVTVLKNAGFKKLIVTAKHHDGFCIWKSAYTDYDMDGTNYKNGQGDILAELSAECSAQDMDMGLYLSPWDIHAPSYGYFDANNQPLVGSDGNPLKDADGNNFNKNRAKTDKEYEQKAWEKVDELDVHDYNEFYINQLKEILGNDKYGNKGKFIEVWMDGAKGSGTNTQNYRFDDFFQTIEDEEGKDCLLFGGKHKATVRWIGNEDGIAPEPNWGTSKKILDDSGKVVDIINGNWSSTNHFNEGFADGDVWTVPECDARITSGWFWGENKKTPRTMEQLSNMYFSSIGRGGTLLLNVPPNKDGGIDQAIVDRINEFGEAIKNTFKTNLVKSSGVTFKASSVRGNDTAYSPSLVSDGNDDTYWAPADGEIKGSIEVDLGKEQTFDVISIEEPIKLGQRVNEYLVEYQNKEGNWVKIESGRTIGSKRLVRTYPTKAQKIRVTVSGDFSTVTQADKYNKDKTIKNETPLISEIGVYKASEGFALGSSLPSSLEVLGCTSETNIKYEGKWNPESDGKYLNGSSTWTNNGSVTIDFIGSKAYVIGSKASDHGKANIYIDGKKVAEIDSNTSKRSSTQVVYETPELEQGNHTIKIERVTGALSFEGLAYLNNESKGMFQFESKEYTTNEESTLKVKVKRIGGTSGEATVLLQPNPGTAIQGQFDTESQAVTFADGEKEKIVDIKTKRYDLTTGDTYFTIELVEPSNGSKVGFNNEAKVTIKDFDLLNRSELQKLYDKYKNINPENYIVIDDNIEKVLEKVKAILDNTSATVEEIRKAYVELDTYVNNSEERINFTEVSPFKFPIKENETRVLEAEYANLFNDTTNDNNYPLQVTTQDWASNGKFINCLNTGDYITIPYIAEKMGTYELTLSYRSGSLENGFTISEENNKFSNQSINAGANDRAAAVHTVKFNIEVTEAGNGLIKIASNENDAPQIDKFDIKLTKIVVDREKMVEKIKEAEEALKKVDVYTDKSLETLAKEVEEAKKLLELDEISDEDFENQLDLLNAAVVGLEKQKVTDDKEVDGDIVEHIVADNNTEEEKSIERSENKNKLPKTGGVSAITIGLIGNAILASGIFILRKKDKKTKI